MNNARPGLNLLMPGKGGGFHLLTRRGSRALGLTIPEPLLSRADEVMIEMLTYCRARA